METEELVPGQAETKELVPSQAEIITKKLEEILTSMSDGKSSKRESQLKQMQTELEEKGSSSGGDLMADDRQFLRELSNDEIQDMGLEVLIASDKSKFDSICSNLVISNINFCRFHKYSNSQQRISRSLW